MDDPRIRSVMWCDECGLLAASMEYRSNDRDWEIRAGFHTQILAGSIRAFRNHRVVIVESGLD